MTYKKKMRTTGTAMLWAQQWWKFYQPVSYSIAEASWLGGKSELTSLCNAASEKGIHIIVDIVANHSANVSDKSLDDRNAVSTEVKDYEADLYNNHNKSSMRSTDCTN